MRTWWAVTAVLALVVGLGAVASPPAYAGTTTDPCSGTSGPPDLQSASFGYSATSFSVGSVFCPQPNTYGEYVVTVHLTSFTPEVQVSAAFEDVGKYLAYSGYRVCATASCTIGQTNGGLLTPPGVQLDGPCLYDALSCPLQATSAYGGWADVLPQGTAIPGTIDWYAEVRLYDQATHGWNTTADRVPDSGAVATTRNTATVATQVTAAPDVKTPVWQPYGTTHDDGGRLSTASGDPIAGRLVQIRPVMGYTARRESRDDGLFTSSYLVDRNTTVRACFVGDGVHDPSCSSPYRVGIKAFVSLNLPQTTTVARGGSLVLQGVVRPPFQAGQVRVLVREDRPGTTYKLLRYASLARSRSDSYYRIPWSPTARGRFVLRTLWTGGTTADGGVQNNISDFRRVTVS